MKGEGATTGGYAFKSKTLQRPNSKQVHESATKVGSRPAYACVAAPRALEEVSRPLAASQEGAMLVGAGDLWRVARSGCISYVSRQIGSTPANVAPGSYEPTATRVGEHASVADMRGEEGAPAKSRALSGLAAVPREALHALSCRLAHSPRGSACRNVRFLQQHRAARRETLCSACHSD